MEKWVDNDAIEGADKAGRQAAQVFFDLKVEIVLTACREGW